MFNNSIKHRSEMVGDQCRRQGGATGAVFPGPPNSAGLVQDLNEHISKMIWHFDDIVTNINEMITK